MTAPVRPSARVQLAAVFRKEVQQTVRDRRVMFMLVVAPLIQTVVFGFAVDYEVDRVTTVVVDPDRSATSREDARRLLADGTLRPVGEAGSADAASAAIDEGRASAALVFERRAEADRLSRRGQEVQVLLDGTDPNRTTVTSGAVSRFFAELGERLAREQLATAGATPPAQLRPVPRVAFNPGLETAPYMVPGIAAMLLVIVTTFTSAMGLAREREMGTLEQVLVTPIRPLLLLVGKMAPFVVIGLVVVTLLVGVGTWIFAVPIRGSLGLLYLGTILYLLTTLGAGLLISTMSANQQQAFLGGFLFTIPAVLLSGLMTPILAMPGWLRPLTLVNPIRWYAEIMRGILLRGAGLADLWLELLVLLVIGVAIVAAATLRFHRRLG
ncbi:ABC transporter permease [Anaeromyxobacter sp. Fw109-5]|uniref:ABC transporter permease n=1 Tax=Anaeromyxobacter sp. (strain Fw109-5) TaxID=404589 RepID=UPI0000ED7FB5|nr:ABC transporter permease [Anaeromyxobacter sp. Fw109-5]ABS25105.1 ABC-2 type transporter [Anaeromyxobacter sp. Fw109-5]